MKLGLLCGGYAPVSTSSPGKFFFSAFYQLARTSTFFKNVTHAFVLFCASSAQLQLSTTESLLPCMCLLLEIPHLAAYASCDICWQLWFIAFPWCTYACSLLAFELNVSHFFFFLRALLPSTLTFESNHQVYFRAPPFCHFDGLAVGQGTLQTCLSVVT